MTPDHSAPAPAPAGRGFTAATIRLFERTIPDPFVLAILITMVVALAVRRRFGRPPKTLRLPLCPSDRDCSDGG